MKIFIYYKFKNGPWGGGNQFLKMLKDGFIENNYYIDSFKKADTILFDSYQEIFSLIKCWFLTKKIIIYRLGPIFHLHRNGIKWKMIDHFVILIANLFADLVIFQSHWSYEQALILGFSKKKKYSVILNTINTDIFFKKKYIQKNSSDKLKLIYTSWSTNNNKGFSYLDFLDKNLDFDKYQMTFVGNSPIRFNNINIIKPLASKELAEELRKSDIFISPTKDDACSNAILEALSCGLPVVALNSGGNFEIIKEAGITFKTEQELIFSIDNINKDLFYYYNKILTKSPEVVCIEYVSAINQIC